MWSTKLLMSGSVSVAKEWHAEHFLCWIFGFFINLFTFLQVPHKFCCAPAVRNLGHMHPPALWRRRLWIKVQITDKDCILTCLYLNAWSFINKFDAFSAIVCELEHDILGVTDVNDAEISLLYQAIHYVEQTDLRITRVEVFFCMSCHH